MQPCFCHMTSQIIINHIVTQPLYCHSNSKSPIRIEVLYPPDSKKYNLVQNAKLFAKFVSFKNFCRKTCVLKSIKVMMPSCKYLQI